MIRKIVPLAFDSFGARSMATFIETDLHTLVLDHHFLRDLKYKTRIKPVYEAAEKHGVKVITAVEFCERKIEMLEALRKELYAKHGEVEVKDKKQILRDG